MPHPITLILKDRRGNTLDLYELDPAAPLTLDAVAGAYYQLNDETTGFAPQNLHARRNGDALHISIDGHDALTIAHYYSRDAGALIGLQENGGMQRYPLAPAHTLASETATAAPAAILGGVALIAGGAALTAHHHDRAPEAQNTPDPEPPTPPVPTPPTPTPPTPTPPTPTPPTPTPPTPTPPTPTPPTPTPPTPTPPTPTPPTPTPPTPTPPTENHAPTGAVTVSGKIQAGATIHASNSLADADGMGDVHYQWLADGETIGSGADYTLNLADIGKTISVRASYTDGLGNLESRDSLPTAAVGKAAVAPPFTNTFDEPTFPWAGVDWFARDTDWAPGAPQKSGEWSRDNIRVHGDTLEMQLTNGSGESPVAAQISSSEAMGYGSYQLTVSADFRHFDAYTVFGFFTYEWAKPSIPGHRKLDAIEISRWGGSALQGLFTYWPTDDAIKVRPAYAWPDGLDRATIRMDWTAERITWTVSDPESGKTLHQISSTENIPVADKQQIHLNFWTYSYDAPGWHKAKAQHINVESFSYTPADGDSPSPHAPPLQQLLEQPPLLRATRDDTSPSAPHEQPAQYRHASAAVAVTPLHEDELPPLAGII